MSAAAGHHRRPAGFGSLSWAWPYIGSTGLVAAALLAAKAIAAFVHAGNVSLVFLPAVVASAVAWGLGPSLWAGVLSVLGVNFFFLPPLYTFTVADPENVIALVVFAAVALITSELAARMRRAALAAQLQAKTTAALYDFSGKLAGAGRLDDLLWATVYQIASMLRLHVVLLRPQAGSLRTEASYPPEDQISRADSEAAQVSWKRGIAAGRGTAHAPGARRFFLPLHTDRGVIGVVGVEREDPEVPLGTEEQRLLAALADQAAVAIERATLAAHLEEARVEAETERLRAALLASTSHDLRTPLASIVGAVTSLRRYAGVYDEAARDELLATVQEEAERLNRFVGNLLDMTRLQSGAIEPKRSPVDIGDVVGTALRRAEPMLAHHRIETAIAPDLPMLSVDDLLLDQVLVNLLDNAAKYAPPGTLVRIAAHRDEARVAIEVSDEGPGIPEAELGLVFDKFYRVRAGDRRPAGTGLGLAICRGFVEAMGGTISARNRADRSGASFIIAFPLPELVQGGVAEAPR